MKNYRLYEVSDGVMGSEILRGTFLSMPHAVLAWWRAFGGDNKTGWAKELLLVTEATSDGGYGDTYGVKIWDEGGMPTVFPMRGEAG